MTLRPFRVRYALLSGSSPPCLRISPLEAPLSRIVFHVLIIYPLHHLSMTNHLDIYVFTHEIIVYNGGTSYSVKDIAHDC